MRAGGAQVHPVIDVIAKASAVGIGLSQGNIQMSDTLTAGVAGLVEFLIRDRFLRSGGVLHRVEWFLSVIGGLRITGVIPARLTRGAATATTKAKVTTKSAAEVKATSATTKSAAEVKATPATTKSAAEVKATPAAAEAKAKAAIAPAETSLVSTKSKLARRSALPV